MSQAIEEGMGGLAKGFAIVESFRRDRPRLTVSEAAKLTGQTPSAARRCMRTLESLGYLQYDGKFYRPTPRFLRLANIYTESDPIPRIATPLLEQLRDEIDESASLSRMDGDSVVFIARAEAHHFVSTGQNIGSRLPTALSAAGRVMLASSTDGGIRAIAVEGASGPHTGKAILDPDALLAEVRACEERGYSITDEEVERGLRAVAVPVFDHTGTIVAAMSLSAPTSRASVAQMVDAFVPALRRTAETFSRMI